LRNVYRAQNSLKVFGASFLAFSLLFSIGAWKGVSVGTNTWADLAIGIALACVGTFFSARAFTLSVVLTEESISYGSVFRRQSMRLNEIRYRREYEEYKDGPDGGVNVHYLELVPRDGECHSLRISKDDFDFDHAFWERMLRIPDFERLKPRA
jgi:hypothetical protein